MATKDLGPLYFTKVTMPVGVWPPFTYAETRRTEPPWRIGRGIAIRFSRERAAVFGVWGFKRKFETEEDGLRDAMRAHLPNKIHTEEEIANRWDDDVPAWADKSILPAPEEMEDLVRRLQNGPRAPSAR